MDDDRARPARRRPAVPLSARRRFRYAADGIHDLRVLVCQRACRDRAASTRPVSTSPRCSASATRSACYPRTSIRSTGELWGNFPQTYSLVGIINSALRLSRPWEDHAVREDGNRRMKSISPWLAIPRGVAWTRGLRPTRSGDPPGSVDGEIPGGATDSHVSRAHRGNA